MSSTVICLQNNEDNYSLKQQQQQSVSQQISFQASKKIGSGKTSDVYLVYLNNFPYAVKNYKENHIKFMQNEIDSLSKLAHPNIIAFLQQTGQNKLLLEYCDNGEVFDYIAIAAENFPPELSRFYGLQLSLALDYMHDEGYAHLDLKLENCLFDQDFNLKLADFGFCTEVEKNKKHNKFIGTHRYMAPEIENSIPYDPIKADIFALGCVIFIMELGFQPIHTKAVQNDKYYQYFAYNQLPTFWKWLEKQFKKEINADFKDLIGKMMCFDPSKRISMKQVLKHPYFKQYVCDPVQRIQYMNLLKTNIQLQQQIKEQQQIQNLNQQQLSSQNQQSSQN